MTDKPHDIAGLTVEPDSTCPSKYDKFVLKLLRRGKVMYVDMPRMRAYFVPGRLSPAEGGCVTDSGRDTASDRQCLWAVCFRKKAAVASRPLQAAGRKPPPKEPAPLT